MEKTNELVIKDIKKINHIKKDMASDYDSDSDSDSEVGVDTVVVKPTDSINLTTKEKYYYIFIKKFFKSLDQQKIDKMINIVNEKSKISLRQLDWFVTRYSNKNIKNKKITYKLTNETKEDDVNNFNVHISYKAQLKSYRKKYFDPFRRRSKFYFNFNIDETKKTKKQLLTTIGQLNFFRWAFQYEVIDYVEQHYDEISNAMIQSNKDDKKRKSNVGKKKKVTLIRVNKKNINVKAKKEITQNNEVKITLSFD